MFRICCGVIFSVVMNMDRNDFQAESVYLAYFLLQLKSTCPWVAPLVRAWALPHQSRIKKSSHRCTHRPLRGKIFLNWDPFFPNHSSFCPIYKWTLPVLATELTAIIIIRPCFSYEGTDLEDLLQVVSVALIKMVVDNTHTWLGLLQRSN